MHLWVSLAISWLSVFCCTLGKLENNTIYTFTTDLSSSNRTQVWDFWTSGTVIDDALLLLRADLQKQLKMIKQDLNIKYIRFHSILDDRIGIINPKDESLGYSFFNVDQIYDFLQSIDLMPIVELDFIPSSLVPLINGSKDAHLSQMYEYPVYVGPPANYTQWYLLIKNFVQHITDRYGSDTVSKWVFDAWYEPNCGHNWMSGNDSINSGIRSKNGKGENNDRIPRQSWDDYMFNTFGKTWNYTSRAVKDVNNEYIVGAPGTCGNQWSAKFPQWCVDNNVPLDFFSTHVYPENSHNPLPHDSYFNMISNLSDVIYNIDKNMQIGITAYGCTVESTTNHSIGPHDTNYNSVCFLTFASQFQKLSRRETQFKIMAFTGPSDLWDQQGVFSNEFHNGYGWLTERSIKKPMYHGLKLLNDYANDRYVLDVKRINSHENNTTLEVMITEKVMGNVTQLAVFIMNWIIQGEAIKQETVQVIINNYTKTVGDGLGGSGDKYSKRRIRDAGFLNNYSSSYNATVYRIDSEHCNPSKVWKNLGSPTYPTASQLETIKNASQIVAESIDVNTNGDQAIEFKIDVPAYGLAVVVIDISH